MADRTGIQWTDATWNPVRGCSRVSPGCTNCYAMRQAHRTAGPGGAYEHLTTIRNGRVDWVGWARLVPSVLEQPLRWRRPRRIFVNSMSDLFHQSLSNEEIAAVFGVMAAAPRHTFQVLTKRPKRALEFFQWMDSQGDEIEGIVGFPVPSGSSGQGSAAVMLLDKALGGKLTDVRKGPASVQTFVSACENSPWPLRNVWLGVSAENQETANERIPYLMQCPAAVRFVSAEPLLGPLVLDEFMRSPAYMREPAHRERTGHKSSHSKWCGECGTNFEKYDNALDWVIVGGESGPGARECDAAWIRSLVSQCKNNGAACFVKQFGSNAVKLGGFTGELRRNALGRRRPVRSKVRLEFQHSKGGDPSEWPTPGEWPQEFPEVGGA